MRSPVAMPSILPARVSGLGYAVGGRHLLAGVGFELAPGDRTVILGPNGAGKSLLLRLLHGLIQPSSGKVQWAIPWPQARRRQAMVFQRPVLLRRSTLANVRYALGRRAGAGRPETGAALAILRAFGLEARARTAARLLSGGEQQRLALARAWAVEPEVLLLDEPCAALDPASSRAVEQAIAEFVAAGAKIVLTTHDLSQARRLADEVLFLVGGRLLEQSPADRFFNAPASEAARRFLAGELIQAEP